MYSVLADIVVFVHLAWIGFLLFGAFAGIRYRVMKYIHIGGLGFSIFMQAMDWYCPLTHLEFWLRNRHEPGLAYQGSFIAHYAEKIIYLDVTPLAIRTATLALCAVNACVYLWATRTKAGK